MACGEARQPKTSIMPVTWPAIRPINCAQGKPAQDAQPRNPNLIGAGAETCNL